MSKDGVYKRTNGLKIERYEKKSLLINVFACLENTIHHKKLKFFYTCWVKTAKMLFCLRVNILYFERYEKNPLLMNVFSTQQTEVEQFIKRFTYVKIISQKVFAGTPLTGEPS